MTKLTFPLAAAAAVALGLAVLATPHTVHAAPITTYLALGDSMAFGETDFTQNPSNGDRGYVGLYASYLGGQNGGARPIVANLGVDGETSSTFFGGPSVGTPPNRRAAPLLNTNYPNGTTNQNALMLATIAAAASSGHPVTNVTVQLGANDLYQLVSNPAFFTETPAQQHQAILGVLNTLQTNYTHLLTELTNKLPNAQILVLGYPNAFNANPNSPIGQIADPAIKGLNALIAAEAKHFGVGYVDTYSPFVGNETALTYISSGNPHPNAAGYDVIATQIESVPEPATLFVMGSGIAGWLALGRRKRRLAA